VGGLWLLQEQIFEQIQVLYGEQILQIIQAIQIIYYKLDGQHYETM
jgi:hypothetical protein